MTYQPSKAKQLFHNSRRLLAKKWLSFVNPLQIAITGSQGKTNTTQIIYQILRQAHKTIVTDINLDTIYNVPITALTVTLWTKYAVFELGIDQPNEMERHLEIVNPKIAVITGISPVHTDREHLGSIGNLIREKRRLIEHLPKDGFAVLNYDDVNVRQMAPYTKAKILWYGLDPNHCHLWSSNITVGLAGTTFSFNFNYLSHPVSTGLIGQQNVYNIMAACLVIIAVNQLSRSQISIKQLVDAIAKLKPLSGRMSVGVGPLNTTLINDALRANPASTAYGLKTFSSIAYGQGKKIAILGEMGELANPKVEHEKIGRLFGDLEIDYLISIGPWQKFTVQEALKHGMKKDRVYWVNDITQAAAILKKIINRGDLLYLKGSLLRHLERIILILENKKVGCRVNLCPFYNQCFCCSYLAKGYSNPKN